MQMTTNGMRAEGKLIRVEISSPPTYAGTSSLLYYLDKAESAAFVAALSALAKELNK